MFIGIKSEMDSRVIIYPLMRALMHYGSILVISRNPFFKRLIDDAEFSTFRDISIVVSNEDAIDGIYGAFDIKPTDYDFIIADNMGISEYDALFLLFGNSCSDLFWEDKEAMELGEDVNKIFFIDYSTKSEKKQQKSQEGAMEGYDPADKYKRILGEEKRKEVRSYKSKLPTYADIEQVEAEHRFYQVDDSLIHAFYEALNSALGVSEDNFRKELRLKDEGSYSI